MRLPRFVLLLSPDDNITDMVLETRPPYLLGKIYGIPTKEQELVEEQLSAIASGRTTAVKMPGFSVFAVASGSLSGDRLGKEETLATLRDMLDYYRDAASDHKKRRWRAFQEVTEESDVIAEGRRYRAMKAKEQERYHVAVVGSTVAMRDRKTGYILSWQAGNYAGTAEIDGREAFVARGKDKKEEAERAQQRMEEYASMYTPELL